MSPYGAILIMAKSQSNRLEIWTCWYLTMHGSGQKSPEEEKSRAVLKLI